MIISFDGNAYTGKTTLIRVLSDRYGYNAINEHSFFLNDVKKKFCYDNSYLNTQLQYLGVDKYRRKFINKNIINLLDRSLVSMSAHVYALHDLGLTDIRKEYLNLLESRIEEILIPDVFVMVSCKHSTSYVRCLEVNNEKQTENMYLSEKYFESITKFNTNWIAMVGGHTISTEDNPDDSWIAGIQKNILSSLRPVLKNNEAVLNGTKFCLEV